MLLYIYIQYIFMCAGQAETGIRASSNSGDSGEEDSILWFSVRGGLQTI